MQKELLSAYMDGEQVNPTFTEQLCQDAELQESWEDFHTIRSIMRKESNVVLGADFTTKMESLIATEEIQVSNAMTSQPLPQEVENAPFMQKLKAWLMPITQVAVAAIRSPRNLPFNHLNWAVSVHSYRGQSPRYGLGLFRACIDSIKGRLKTQTSSFQTTFRTLTR